MNPNPQPSGLLSALQTLVGGLSPHAGLILVQALQRKQISRSEMVDVLLPEARDANIEGTIGVLSHVFRSYGIEPVCEIIVTEPVATTPATEAEAANVVELPKQPTPRRPRRKSEDEANDPLAEQYRVETDGHYNADTLLTMHLNAIASYPLLKPDELHELAVRSFTHKDIEARDKIVLHNLRLVVYFAKKFKHRAELADLVQEGTRGLVRAAERYNPYLESSFATYAKWWIEHFVKRFIQNMAGPIRLPTHIWARRFKLFRQVMDLGRELGRMPSKEEVFERTGYKGGVDGAVALISDLKTRSLDELINPDDSGSTSFGEMIPDNNVKSAAMLIDAKEKLDEKCRDVRELVISIKQLGYSERDQNFFFRYYGLEDWPEGATLEEIGESQTPVITRERVRQIISCIWEDLEDHKIDFDDVSLMDTLELISRFEVLTGVKADIVCKKTDRSLLLDEVKVVHRDPPAEKKSTLVVTRIVKDEPPPEAAATDPGPSKVQQLEAPRRRVGQLASAIKKLELSLREEEVFNTHYGLNGKARIADLDALASRNLLLVTRVREMLAAIWAKIATSKRVEFIKDEASLLADLDLIAQLEKE